MSEEQSKFSGVLAKLKQRPAEAQSIARPAPGIHAKRDKLPSIAYSEELICAMSATLQSTDRHHGIVGQERCHFQRDL
jgi:hypothetical protein